MIAYLIFFSPQSIFMLHENLQAAITLHFAHYNFVRLRHHMFHIAAYAIARLDT
jgi:hypothetical protein